jgi:hypothetical protein
MRSELRLKDLKGDKAASKLMNVKVPDSVSRAIEKVAKATGSSKTATVVALLNEGLDVLMESTPEARNRRPARRRRPRRGRPPKKR